MKIVTIALLTTLVIIVLSPAAFAEATTAQEKEQARAFIGFITFGPLLFMLMALPLAIICRASTRITGKVSAALEEKPGTALLLGAANLLLMAILGWAGEQVEIIGIIGFVFLLALAVAIFIGLTAVADLLGRRIFAGGPRSHSVGAFTVGWLVLAGVSLLPIVGFLAHMWFAAKGVGAVVLSLGGGKAAAPADFDQSSPAQ